jgi:FixJ family two-component response regulator
VIPITNHEEVKMATVFIVDDDEAFRQSLKYLLESVEMQVETYASAEAFLKGYTLYTQGCLLLDVRMPEMSGLQLQQELAKHPYPLPVIMLTGHGDVPMAVQAMKYGAMEFMEKPFNDQELLERIQMALKKDKQNYKKRIDDQTIKARLASLTRRETEVLHLITNKYANKTIAEKLHVSIKTVESHRKNVMNKMYAKSLVDLLDMLRHHQ